MRPDPRVLLSLGLALVSLLGLLGAEPTDPVRARPAVGDVQSRVVCSFDTGVLPELSGLARSNRHPGIAWATNDSEGGPLLFALDLTTCAIRASLRLLDTPARDHEALAVGTDAQGRDVIWIGDIGDNLNSWPYARIHKVIEPATLVDASVEVTTYRFTYPQGPTNAEALLADPDSERLWVVTKETGTGGGIYALPSPMSDSQTPMQTTRVGNARALITDGSVSPDGRRYVLRDYFTAEVFDGNPPGTAQARFRLPLQRLGEAVTWAADGEHLFIASEGTGDLLEVAVPATALGTDTGIAGHLPRVAGFDIYPYVRILGAVLALLAGLVWWRRTRRRRS